MDIAIKRLNETMAERYNMIDTILCLHTPRLTDKAWDKMEEKLNDLSYLKLKIKYDKVIINNLK